MKTQICCSVFSHERELPYESKKSNAMSGIFAVVVTIALMLIPVQAEAANKDNSRASKANSSDVSQPSKERLVLMPLRVPEEDKNLSGAMETALVEGLHQKYDVYSGEQVSQKARQIFLKESQNIAHKECDETRCMQDIAEAFQAELIATANVTKQGGSYFLALSIQNIFDNKVVYSKSFPCKGCDVTQVIDILKEMSNTSLGYQMSQEEAAARKAEEIKNKAEQIKQEELAFVEKLKNADESEKKRLLDAKAKDDKNLAELKAQAEARRKRSESQVVTDFPTVESAIAEIGRLNENIKSIESGYETELAQTRDAVSQRYKEQLTAVDNTQRDEFERVVEFQSKQEKRRNELINQRDAELARLNLSAVSASEVSPLRDKIKSLSEREYTVSAESLVVNIGTYDVEAQQFPVHIFSKLLGEKWEVNGFIFLPIADAKIYKKQWLAGLVRGEAKMKPAGEIKQIELLNDADSSRLINYGGIFMTDREREIHEAANAKAKAEADVAAEAEAKRMRQARIEDEQRKKEEIKKIEDARRKAEDDAEDTRASEARRRSAMPTFSF